MRINMTALEAAEVIAAARKERERERERGWFLDIIEHDTSAGVRKRSWLDERLMLWSFEKSQNSHC